MAKRWMSLFFSVGEAESIKPLVLTWLARLRIRITAYKL